MVDDRRAAVALGSPVPCASIVRPARHASRAPTASRVIEQARPLTRGGLPSGWRLSGNGDKRAHGPDAPRSVPRIVPFSRQENRRWASIDLCGRRGLPLQRQPCWRSMHVPMDAAKNRRKPRSTSAPTNARALVSRTCTELDAAGNWLTATRLTGLKKGLTPKREEALLDRLAQAARLDPSWDDLYTAMGRVHEPWALSLSRQEFYDALWVVRTECRKA